MTYFAAYQLNTNCAVMVTGSHNPPDYNGLKMVLGGETLSGDTIQALRTRIGTRRPGPRQRQLPPATTSPTNTSTASSRDVKLARPMKIIVDCGNGVAGAFAPKLYRDMGCEVEEMFCEVDGNFPNHHPDPSVPENLQDLIARLKTSDAEIGLAFDGDGDRLGVVTKDGRIIFPDRQLMLFAARRAVAQSRRGNHLRRQIHPQPVRLDPRARRQAAAVENRPLLHQGQDEGNRRPAGRRDERPHLLQGTLVRLRRRPLRRRAHAGISSASRRTSTPPCTACRIP